MAEGKRYEELKKALFMAGNDYIEEFLGFSDDVYDKNKDEIERLMDETYDQMPDDILEEFYQKYNI